MKTPKQMAEVAIHSYESSEGDAEIRGWLLLVSARDILSFLFLLDSRQCGRHLPFIRAALDVRLADDAEKQSDRLEKQMVELVGIAAEQKRLAAELDAMTQRLLMLTRWLKWLTVGLVFLTLVLCLLELGGREFFSKRRLSSAESAPHIQQTNQAGQHDGNENTQP